MTVELGLAHLKLAYRMRDWDGVREALEWLEQEGYLNAALLVTHYV